MADLPNPLNLVPGRRSGVPGRRSGPDDDVAAAGEVTATAGPPRAPIVRSRVGSPNVLVSLPFSQIEIHETDQALVDDVAELVTLVAELAVAVTATLGEDRAELRATVDAVRERTEALRDRLPSPPTAD